jgi:hypothetical protein
MLEGIGNFAQFFFLFFYLGNDVFMIEIKINQCKIFFNKKLHLFRSCSVSPSFILLVSLESSSASCLLHPSTYRAALMPAFQALPLFFSSLSQTFLHFFSIMATSAKLIASVNHTKRRIFDIFCFFSVFHYFVVKYYCKSNVLKDGGSLWGRVFCV